MSEARVLTGSNAASAGALAQAVLCSQQFIMVVFVDVCLLVGLGVLWWTGRLFSGAMLGVIYGLAVAFKISAVSTAVGRSGERLANSAATRTRDPVTDRIAEQGRKERSFLCVSSTIVVI